ncbi:MAG: ABC transporter permease, partial [Planctomycetota bacterium]
MGNIWNIAIKDLRLLARDPLSLFFIFAFPVGMGLLFGAISSGFGSGKVQISLAVVDEDQSVVSQQFVEDLQNHTQADVVPRTREEAMEDVRRGRKAGLIAIPQGFGEHAGVLWEKQIPLQVGVDPSRQAEAGMLQGLIMQTMADITFSRMQDPAAVEPFLQDARDQITTSEDLNFASRAVLTTFLDSVDQMMASLNEVREVEDQSEGEPNGLSFGSGGFQLAEIEMIDVTRKPAPGSTAELVQKVRSPWDITFPQAMLWGFLGCVAGFAGLLVREHDMGTFTRLAAAPLPRWQILSGKGLACFLSVLSVITVMMTVGYFLGMRPRRWDLLILASLSMAFCFVGLMMLFSVLGKTEQSVTGTAWGINMVMAMFGGGMLPLAFMPKFMKTASNLDPVKWGTLAMEGAIWRGFSLSEMLFPCAILLG